MANKFARISVTHGGHEQVLPEVPDPLPEVSRLLRTYVGASDVTVSIKLPYDQGTLLVALESGNAFVSLETPDGIYQYVTDQAAEGEHRFTIGDQPTIIEARHVLPIPAAITLLTACLAGPGPFAAPAWERQ